MQQDIKMDIMITDTDIDVTTTVTTTGIAVDTIKLTRLYI
jgi:hypothetical protein